jgi:hypothetical protein
VAGDLDHSEVKRTVMGRESDILRETHNCRKHQLELASYAHFPVQVMTVKPAGSAAEGPGMQVHSPWEFQ